MIGVKSNIISELDIHPQGYIITCAIDQDSLLVLLGIGNPIPPEEMRHIYRKRASEMSEKLEKVDKLEKEKTLLELRVANLRHRQNRLILHPHKQEVRNEADHLVYNTIIDKLTKEVRDIDNELTILRTSDFEFFRKYESQRLKKKFKTYQLVDYNLLTGAKPMVLGEFNEEIQLTSECMEIHWIPLLKILRDRMEDAQEVVEDILKYDVGKNYNETAPFGIHLERGQGKGWTIKPKQGCDVEIYTVEDMILWLENAAGSL